MPPQNYFLKARPAVYDGRRFASPADPLPRSDEDAVAFLDDGMADAEDDSLTLAKCFDAFTQDEVRRRVAWVAVVLWPPTSPRLVRTVVSPCPG